MNKNDKELYSYIVSSLDILNKQLVVQEKNVVKLFSYLYNYNTQLEDKIQDLETIVLDQKLNMVKLNEKYNELEKDNKQIKEQNEKTIKDFEEKINKKIDNDIKRIKKSISDNNQIIINEVNNTIYIKEFFINIFNKIKNQYIKLKDKIYKKIYRKKILKEQEEETQKQIELQEKKRKEELNTIKDILNNIKK